MAYEHKNALTQFCGLTENEVSARPYSLGMLRGGPCLASASMTKLVWPQSSCGPRPCTHLSSFVSWAQPWGSSSQELELAFVETLFPTLVPVTGSREEEGKSGDHLHPPEIGMCPEREECVGSIVLERERASHLLVSCASGPQPLGWARPKLRAGFSPGWPHGWHW